MSALPWLFLLFLLGKRKPGGTSTSTSPAQTGPAAFPQTPAASTVPASMPSGPTFSKQWVPYHPLTQPVIARAEQLLRDPTHPAPSEVIERDPGGGGNVRYLKVAAPKGHVSVTAWKPTLATPAPAARAPGARRLVHHA